ncbi:lipopolysaccharide-induced tumor necrosis factor-alpha factor homolog isoform X2 [Leuresthes tenuis]|uniref:lipopolysaccharide-induced tumor necrosis factor-alpha factor homolog isoform X2 n=1 Tax=Leuresthes tenuis TaxID=355514 RepID=UPI003B50228A
MEKGYPPQESAPPYPGPPCTGPSYPGPSYPGPSYPGPPCTGPSYPGPSYPGPPCTGPSYPGPSYPGPSYPGPPLNNRGAMPQPGMYPQPGHPPVPPPAGYQGGVVFAPATIVSTDSRIVAAIQQDTPVQTVCPFCQQSVVTNTEHIPGLLTWAIFGGLALFGCWLCCCFPFCIDSCKDVEHRCPSCHRVICKYKRV